ncbi:MAG TPA: hypothetical protein VFI70_00315 [Nitrososphaeraceae archaeon]|nr:hypothetical protein [Nitrososphaeraceae archaeon]
MKNYQVRIRTNTNGATGSIMLGMTALFALFLQSITEGINFQIEAETDNADKQQLQELLKMAQERCPAMYSMIHEINVSAMIK